jgi:hypothetical protein
MLIPVRSIFGSLLAATLTSAAVAGCKHHEDPPPQTLPGVSPVGMRADADRMILDGQRLREQGIALRSAGKDGDDLIQRGEQMMADGQRLRDRAMMLEPP